MSQEQGFCPKCHMHLNYDSRGVEEYDADNIVFHAVCPSCGWHGKEVCKVEFSHFEDYD